MEICESKKKEILKCFDKFINVCKSSEEFERLVKLVLKSRNDEIFLEYVGPLLILGEFYEILPKNENWDDIIYEYMMRIKDGVEKYLPNISISLFNGLSDIGYSVYSVYKKTGYYGKFLNTLNSYIVEELNNLLDIAENNVGNMYSTDYDTIYGFAGIGGYLLMFKEDENILNALKRIIKLFVNMTMYIEVKGYKVPGWYIPAEKLFDDKSKEQYENGNFNEALSHGICGPLVFMSLSLNEGIEIKGQKEAIKNIIDELLRFSHKDEFENIYWTGIISFDDYIKGEENEINTNRQSWCYGTIGIARSLYIAGNAIKNQDILKFSNEILEGISEMNIDSWMLQCSHICHGYGGALAIMEAMNKDNKNEKYESCIEKLADIIIDSFDSNSLFGFYNYTTQRDKTFNEENLQLTYQDDHTFLEGSLGTVLALMTYLEPNRDYWMRHIMIK